MPSPSSTSNSKPRNPLAAVWIFAAMVVILETTLAWLPNNALVKTLHARAVPDVAPTWQIMGDSVAYSGLVATQLVTTLPPGQTVANLAMRGSGPEFPYFQLQREINAGRAPKAILYAPSPHTFATKRIPLLVGAFCTWPEVVEAGATGIEPLDVLYGALCKMSYTLRYRDEIAFHVKSFGTSNARVAGKSPSASVPGDNSHPRFTVENLNPTYKRAFTVNPFNAHFLHKFLQLAATNQIPVCWVTPPVMNAVYESRARYDFEPDYLQFLAGLEQQKQIHILQGNFLVWDEQLFSDSSHLTPEGARRLTQVVAEKIRQLDETGGQAPPQKP